MRKSLFSKDDIAPKADAETGAAFSVSKGLDSFFSSAKSRAELVKHIGELKQGMAAYTFVKSAWSSHELLAYILEQTGPAQVWLTSWSITEEPMRKLINLVSGGYISELQCLFGDRVPVMNPNAYQLASFNIVKLRLGKCHAKVQVIRNERFDVVVMGSANFTINPRWEAGVVLCDKVVAECYSNAIMNAINEGNEIQTKQ